MNDSAGGFGGGGLEGEGDLADLVTGEGEHGKGGDVAADGESEVLGEGEIGKGVRSGGG